MSKYILIYKGEASDVSAMSEEDQKAVMDKWQEWMDKVGQALVDVGSPFGKDRVSVVDDGSDGNPTPLEGYSIVEAGNLDEAKAMCDGHPFLSEGKGDFAIDVYELMPAPF